MITQEKNYSINNNSNNKNDIIKQKSQLMNKINDDIHNTNNFISNSIKINEKIFNHNEQCPPFQELEEIFFEDNKIEVSLIYFNTYI